MTLLHTDCNCCEVARADIDDLRLALLAASQYIDMAAPNLGKARANNYRSAASTYRRIAAGEMKFSEIAD